MHGPYGATSIGKTPSKAAPSADPVIHAYNRGHDAGFEYGYDKGYGKGFDTGHDKGCAKYDY